MPARTAHTARHTAYYCVTLRAGKIERVKRKLLREAVADNLETIRGLPPRNVRRSRRLLTVWLRRAPILLIPITLAGSTWFVANTNAISSPASTRSKPVLLARRNAPRRTIAAATLDPSAPMTAIDSSAFPLSVTRVVLDAGHGGVDPGTVSTSLVSEKDITLDIQRRLRGLLEHDGFEVVATRSSDQFVPLRERAKLANTSNSDIFVSIHVNSIRNPERHGVETYYLGATNDPSLTTLAAAENRASGYSLSDMRRLLDGVYADARRDESHRLATVMQGALFTNLQTIDPGVQNWGVKRAPFIVLVATEMPAVLAEVGCLSNEKEAAMLRKPEYRQEIANALLRGIRAYANKR
jgi:N-acetylmuramoyl-L-alanine amidase